VCIGGYICTVGPHLLLANTQRGSPPAPRSAERNATARDGCRAGTEYYTFLFSGIFLTSFCSHIFLVDFAWNLSNSKCKNFC
jgi:hypothetical protein